MGGSAATDQWVSESPVSTASAVTTATAPIRTWAGVEVFEAKGIARDELLRDLPLSVGKRVGDLAAARRALLQWAQDTQERLGLLKIEASFVRYVNGDTYAVIDAVHHDEAHRIRFREPPTESLPLASADVLKLQASLNARIWELFEQGETVREETGAGFLDYDDPVAHELVLHLVEQTPGFRSNILDVLQRHRDVNVRAQAAQLLNWAGAHETSIPVAHTLLDDPEVLVRNNISRYMLHFVSLLENPREQHRLIDSLATQIDRPSHADRNKAVYSLLHLVSEFPAVASYIRDQAGESIGRLARESVLANVRDPARALAERIDQPV